MSENKRTRCSYITRKYVYAVACITIASAFQHGFQLTVLNAATMFVHKWIALSLLKREDVVPSHDRVTTIYGNAVNMYPLGGIFGSLITNLILNRFGPRLALQVNNIYTILSSVLLVLIPYTGSYEFLIVMRILSGISGGMSTVLCPVVLVDIAPECLRAATGSFYQVALLISMFASNVLVLPSLFGTDKHWGMMFLVPLIAAIIMVFGLRFIPETPKFTYFSTKDEDETEESLAWFRNTWDVAEELEVIKDEINMQQLLPKLTIKSFFEDPALRTPLVVSCVLMFSQQWTGVNHFQYYSTIFFDRLASTYDGAVAVSGFLTFVILMATIACILLVERVGRRLLLNISFLGCMFSSIIIAFSCYYHEDNPETIRYFIYIFSGVLAASHGLGIGPIPCVFPLEAFPYKSRNLGMCFATFVSWVADFVYAQSSIHIIGAIKEHIFFVYSGCSLFCFLFCYYLMPEMKGKNHKDIIKMYNYKLDVIT